MFILSDLKKLRISSLLLPIIKSLVKKVSLRLVSRKAANTGTNSKLGIMPLAL